jgi:PAS domain S-box-containing protein
MREVSKLNGLSGTFDRLAQALKQYEHARSTVPQAVGEPVDQLREKQLHQIFDELPIGISLMDAKYRVVRVSAAMADMLGYSALELRGMSFSEFTHPDDVELDRALISQLFAGTIPRYQVEKRYITKDGRIISGQLTATVIRDERGQITFRIATVEDITSRKIAEHKLRRTAERLRALSRRVVDLQETERLKISRELHDEVGQTLTGLKLQLDLASRHTDRAEARLQEALSIVEHLIGQVRTLTLDLRPPMLDDLGLGAALAWHINRFSAQTGMQVHLGHQGIDQPLSQPVATAAYRIVQEALTNVARHAGARSVHVQVGVEQGILSIRIIDDGRGFDVRAALAGGASSGLAGMRERAEFLDGSFRVDSVPGCGTQVCASIPIMSLAAPNGEARD